MGPSDDQLIDWGLGAIGTSVDWLRDHLQAMGVRVHSEARLAAGFAAVESFREIAHTHDVVRFENADLAHDFWSEAVGMDFLSKALHHAWDLGLRPAKPYWSSLASAEPNVFRPANSAQERNRVWELLVASICRTFCDDVTLEEPDVMCSYRGQSVAVALKVAYSERKLWTRTLDGFKQAFAREAEVDIVFVNVVGLMPNAELLRQSARKQFPDAKPAIEWAKRWASDWCSGSELIALHHKLQERASRPATIAFFMPIMMRVQGVFAPLFYVHCPATSEGPDLEFATEFLHACNVALGYRAISP